MKDLTKEQRHILRFCCGAQASGTLRRLDLFSRQSRPGWTAWGNEAGKFDKEVA